MATATGVDPTNGLSYIGNDDYRGYLNYLASGGDKTAGFLIGQGAPQQFGYVNNSGQMSVPLSQDYSNANNNYYSAWSTPATRNNTGGAGSGTTQQQIDDSIGALNDAIAQDDTQYNSAETALQNGLTQLGDDFNKTTSRANEDQNTAHQNYDKQRVQTTADKQTATDKIYQNGNTLAQSVRRILGLASGANSSAFQLAAPHAIATDMTTKMNDNADTFKKNYTAIDDAQNETDTGFNRYLQDLADQRKQKESGLRGGILQQEQSLLADKANNQAKIKQLQGGTYLDGKAAAASTIAKAQAAQSAIDNLFAQFRTPYSVTPVTPTAATTADYNAKTSTINQNGPQPTVDNSPYAIALKKIFGDQTAAPAGVAA